MTVRLTGSMVVLREQTEADVDAAWAIDGDERVTAWLSFDRRSREQVHASVERAIRTAADRPRTEFALAITRVGDDTLVGRIRLAIGPYAHAAKLGYSIHADLWGQGLATDAARTLITNAFDVLGLHRITAAAGPDNAASIAVLSRLGFGYEGRLRDHVFTNGAWRDSVLYSVLASEWPHP